MPFERLMQALPFSGARTWMQRGIAARDIAEVACRGGRQRQNAQP
jgi:hypothetical protein